MGWRLWPRNRRPILETTAVNTYENDLDGGVQALILGHLSEQNNHPVIVRQGAEDSLLRRGIAPRLVIAEQKMQTEVFTY